MIAYRADFETVLTNLRHIKYTADQLADATDEEIKAILALTETKDGVLHRPATETHTAINEIETILRDACNHISYTAEAYQADNGDRPATDGIVYLRSTPQMVLMHTPLAGTKSTPHKKRTTPADLAAMSCILRSSTCLMPPGPITVYVTAIYPSAQIRHLPDPDNIKIKSALDALTTYIGIDDVGDNVSLIIRAVRSDTIEPGIYLFATPSNAPSLTLNDMLTVLSQQPDDIITTHTITTNQRRPLCKLQSTIRHAISGICSHMGL